MSPTKEQILEDVKRVADLDVSGILTRDEYQEQGTYSRHAWNRYFSTFKEMLTAAIGAVGTCEASKVSESEETHEVTKDSWSIILPKTRIHTLEQLLEYCKVDLSIWGVDRFIVNKWEVGAKAGNGELKVEPLFQVKAFLKKKQLIVDVKKELEALKELGKQQSVYVMPSAITFDNPNKGNMLELCLADLHIGKLAWGIETNDKNYNTKLAEASFSSSIDNLLSRVQGKSFDEVLVVLGNDLLNSDDLEGNTTKGTKVNTDGRYHKTFSVARNMVIKNIEKCRVLGPVKVIMVPGNHDMLSVWHLGDSLECYYHKTPDVKIDNAPNYRKYHRFGNVLLMFTHGDKGKRDDFPMCMATERPLDFGQTKFREIHTGHLHKTKLDEKFGVRVRILPSLSPADAWHSENCFIGNLRNAEAYEWNKETGLTTIHVYNDQGE